MSRHVEACRGMSSHVDVFSYASAAWHHRLIKTLSSNLHSRLSIIFVVYLNITQDANRMLRKFIRFSIRRASFLSMSLSLTFFSLTFQFTRSKAFWTLSFVLLTHAWGNISTIPVSDFHQNTSWDKGRISLVSIEPWTRRQDLQLNRCVRASVLEHSPRNVEWTQIRCNNRCIDH